ncbi:MAG: PH domain-containing protein [Candidatus Brockarchaeota archaeon]|nr:PH domain-containing protein [Candidatus Brockarchaeota archaeon]MBO3808208.1 PH domain-containing protein [Candidatus Brockarchaeota archaeon]
MTVRIGEKFKPDPSFKTLQYIYLLTGLGLVLIFPLCLMSVLTMLSPPTLNLAVLAMVVFILAITCLLILVPSIIWINLYYLSLFYTFTESEIIVEKGVWWKHKSIVPYNRITNVDIRQGPVSRMLGLWELRIQTAGYHVAPGSHGVAEAILQGIKNVEEVKSFILNMVGRLRPMAVETESEFAPQEDLEQRILDELKRIREILERKS